jgi:hypothetical protein
MSQEARRQAKGNNTGRINGIDNVPLAQLGDRFLDIHFIIMPHNFHVT